MEQQAHNAPIHNHTGWWSVGMWVNLLINTVSFHKQNARSYSSSNSRYMNRLITRKLREDAMLLRTAVNGGPQGQNPQQKTDMLEEVTKSLRYI
ncbi:hypothetical protein Ct9H90mP29_13990 [bacterium]|nr:MAG: hypothetical protein Ct9H90mP29_13990 [bacterium]